MRLKIGRMKDDLIGEQIQVKEMQCLSMKKPVQGGEKLLLIPCLYDCALISHVSLGERQLIRLCQKYGHWHLSTVGL